MTTSPQSPAQPAPPDIAFGGELLDVTLEPGEHLFLRRSSLILADGPFRLTTHRIAQKRFNLWGLFSGEVRWANRFEAKDAPVRIVAARDYPGRIASLPVSPDRPLALQPERYIAHHGELAFDVRRSAKKEFWVLTRVTGSGRVWIKLPGEGEVVPLTAEGAIVDTNYIAALSGDFRAFGKVFDTGEVLKSGELSNVRLSGTGHYLLQSQNPEEMAGGGGGGFFSFLGDLLPF